MLLLRASVAKTAAFEAGCQSKHAYHGVSRGRTHQLSCKRIILSRAKRTTSNRLSASESVRQRSPGGRTLRHAGIVSTIIDRDAQTSTRWLVASAVGRAPAEAREPSYDPERRDVRSSVSLRNPGCCARLFVSSHPPLYDPAILLDGCLTP